MTIKILKRHLKNIVKRNNIVDESSAEHRKKWQQRYFISSTFTLFTDDERTSSRTFFRPFPSFRACAIRTRIIARGNRVKSQREKVSGKVVKSEKSKGDKGLIPRGEEVLPTELTSLLTDVTRFFEPPRTPLLLRLVKHLSASRLPTRPSPRSPQALSKNHLYVYIPYTYVHCLCTRPFEGGRSGDRFQVSSLAAERGTKRGARGGGRKEEEEEESEESPLESRAFSRFEWNCIVRDCGVARIKELRSWKTRDHTSVIWPALSHSAGININKSLDRSPVTSRLSWFLPTA